MKTPVFLACCLLLCARLADAEPVEINVMGADGAPVADALVQVESFVLDDEDGRTQTLHAARSDAAGVAKFDLQPFAPNSTYFGRAIAFKAGLALGGVEIRRGKGAIQLVAPAVAMGVVIGENGAPLLGAKVELQVMRPAPDGATLFFYGAGARAFAAATETQTGYLGDWRLRDLAPGAAVRVHIEKRGYATTEAEIELADGPLATKLTLEARVAGQLLKPDRTPLAGVEIAPIAEKGAYIAPLTTDAQGRFVAMGLDARLWNFVVNLGDKPYVVSDIATLDLKVGDNALPPIQLQSGVIVRGVVRETNGAPVEVRVTTNLSSQMMTKTVRTDAKGAFSLRVPAGTRSFRLSPTDATFRNANEAKTLTIGPDDQPQIVWVLERAPVARGAIVDEAGAPIRGEFAFARDNRLSMNGVDFTTDENGRFEVPVDIEGAARVWGRVSKNEQYQIVGDNRINLPIKGELKLVARLATPVIFRARAVDGAGQPLAGVEFDALSADRLNGQTVRLRSDENGDLRSENLGVGARLQGATATKEGYELRAPIEVVPDGDNWTTQPIVFDRRDAGLSGTVLDDTSHVQNDVRVFAGGTETRTDAQGAWTLKGLPPGDLLVSALSADGRGFASARVPLGKPLQLQNVRFVERDEALARSVLEQLKTESANTDYAAKDRLSLPVKRDFLEQIKVSSDNPKDSPVRLFYQLLNQTNAPEKGELERETTQNLLEGWRAMSKRADRITAAASLVEARPDWKDAAGASDFVFQLEEDVNGELAGEDPNDRKFRVEGVFALAAAFETLGQTESSDRAFKNALDWTFKIPDADNNGELGREALLTRGIGAFGNAPRLFDKLLNYFAPDSYWHHRALGEIIVPTARARGLQAASVYAEQLRQLPDSRPALVQGDEMPYAPAQQLPYLMENAIVAGGEKAPALALQLARDLKIAPDYNGEPAPNRALIEAAFWQTPALAAETWRAQVPKLSPVEALKIAVRIQPRDEVTARELYDAARAQLEKSARNAVTRFTADSTQVAEFASIEAQFEPARARYRLETAWPGALKEATYLGQLNSYVLAMARVSPARALEMALEVPNGKDYASFDARYALARALAGEN